MRGYYDLVEASGGSAATRAARYLDTADEYGRDRDFQAHTYFSSRLVRQRLLLMPREVGPAKDVLRSCSPSGPPTRHLAAGDDARWPAAGPAGFSTRPRRCWRRPTAPPRGDVLEWLVPTAWRTWRAWRTAAPRRGELQPPSTSRQRRRSAHTCMQSCCTSCATSRHHIVQPQEAAADRREFAGGRRRVGAGTATPYERALEQISPRVPSRRSGLERILDGSVPARGDAAQAPVRSSASCRSTSRRRRRGRNQRLQRIDHALLADRRRRRGTSSVSVRTFARVSAVSRGSGSRRAAEQRSRREPSARLQPLVRVRALLGRHRRRGRMPAPSWSGRFGRIRALRPVAATDPVDDLRRRRRGRRLNNSRARTPKKLSCSAWSLTRRRPCHPRR